MVQTIHFLIINYPYYYHGYLTGFTALMTSCYSKFTKPGSGIVFCMLQDFSSLHSIFLVLDEPFWRSCSTLCSRSSENQEGAVGSFHKLSSCLFLLVTSSSRTFPQREVGFWTQWNMNTCSLSDFPKSWPDLTIKSSEIDAGKDGMQWVLFYCLFLDWDASWLKVFCCRSTMSGSDIKPHHWRGVASLWYY